MKNTRANRWTKHLLDEIVEDWAGIPAPEMVSKLFNIIRQIKKDNPEETKPSK